MAQIVHGIRAILSIPIVYTGFQALLGAHAVRRALVDTAVRAAPGMCVLDVGCGPSEILDYMPGVRYWGFDISERYIAQARERFGSRGQFYCKLLTEGDLAQLPEFDIVLAIGLLHHLDDGVAQDLLRLALHALKPGGRLVTLDPCIHPGQSPIARWLIARDRGQNVRTQSGYASLAAMVFTDCRVEIRHKTGIPYTHCIMECTRT